MYHSLANNNYYLILFWLDAEPLNCHGPDSRDYGIDRKKLDWVITRFEMRNLLFFWSQYTQTVNSELSLLKEHWTDNSNGNGNSNSNPIDWASVFQIHSELNGCLAGDDVSTRFVDPGMNTLDWALLHVIRQSIASIENCPQDLVEEEEEEQ